MSDYVSKHIKCFHPSSDDLNLESRKKIFHYTSALGMYSIIKSNAFRFTDCQFLNDKSEYKYIKTPLKRALNEVENALYNKGIVDLLKNDDLFGDNYEIESILISKSKETRKLIWKHLLKRYYIFCASELKDSLGMWNYYVKDGNYQGYNIEMPVNNLMSCFAQIKNSDIDVFYGQVIYNEKEQVKILKDIILNTDQKLQDFLRNEKDNAERDIAYDEIRGELLAYLEDFRLFFKDSAFANEQEYRFIIKLPIEFDNDDTQILSTGYAVKNGIIVPYCELKFDKQKTISSITLSPILETEIAQNGLRRYLQENKYNAKIPFNQSKIPIRF